MLVVLSDLHFVEESSHYIEGMEIVSKLARPLTYSHNLPARPFQQLAIRLADEAVRNKAKRLDLVLAGDIFDINRTAMWFDKEHNPTNERPYVAATLDAVKADSPLEKLVIRIIDAIADDVMVAETLQVFQALANGCYLDENDKPQEFPVSVTLHHILGNHDRMGNATPAIRNAIRKHLGLPVSDDLFERVLLFENEQTLVRHGQEYDRYNFASDHSKGEPIAAHLPDEQYSDPAFGDFITIDVASRLPYEFRKCHGEATIASTKMLRDLYLRLLEFDDLRPMAAMFNYFSYIPDQSHDDDLNEKYDKKDVWEAIKPVLRSMLEALHNDAYLHGWLKTYSKRLAVIPIGVRIYLRLKLWKIFGLSFAYVKMLSAMGLDKANNIAGAETYAMREEGVKNGRFRFVVAGHTHHPKVSLIDHGKHGECYFIDTGTWRNRIPVTPDYQAFGRVKTLTYVTIYGGNEDLGSLEVSQKAASFDYWSGITERWAVSETAVSGIG